MLVEFDIVLRRVVGSIEIIGVCRIFGGQSINPFNERCYSHGFAESTDGVFIRRDEISYLRVRESHAFCTSHQLVVDTLDRADSFESMMCLNNIVDLVQEPLLYHLQLYSTTTNARHTL